MFKKLLADTIVKWFKSCGILGRQRFWLLYWAYRITGWHIRHKEWDFVLEYLPRLGDWQDVHVLDVGCSRNLFLYEIKARGYFCCGIDLEPSLYDFSRDLISTSILDVRDSELMANSFTRRFSFVTCISVLEHIENNQDIALKNMIHALKVGGRLLLTIPTKEFAQGHPWHGFDITDIEKMLLDGSFTTKFARIIEYTERAGQLCLAIERIK